MVSELLEDGLELEELEDRLELEELEDRWPAIGVEGRGCVVVASSSGKGVGSVG